MSNMISSAIFKAGMINELANSLSAFNEGCFAMKIVESVYFEINQAYKQKH